MAPEPRRRTTIASPLVVALAQAVIIETVGRTRLHSPHERYCRHVAHGLGLPERAGSAGRPHGSDGI